MKRQMDFQAESFIRERKRHTRLRRAIALLCAVVMLLTMNSLKMNADTLEHIPGCGLEEHRHTLACYPLVCPLAEAEPQYEIRRAFTGDVRPHVHSEDCYDDSGNLACGYVESLYYHVHNRWCYDDGGNLVCGLSEIQPHVHTEACYQDVPTLICGQDEYPAHHHTQDCYFTVRELACGLEENPGHIHTAECYYDHNELTCGLEESVGHIHTADCYIPVVETTCGMEEGPGHIHTAECFTRELVCGELESEAHQHTDACYADVLTCEIPEGYGAHTHSESCYTVYNILVCGIPEGQGAHTHTRDCVTSYHTLVCGIPEGEGAHTHTDNCYVNYDYLVCGQEETEGHTHTDACYEHTSELICGEQDGSEWVAMMLGQEGVQVHTHTAECFTTITRNVNGEERTLRFATCGYQEIPTITCQESDWTSYPVLVSEGHAHTDACYDLTAEPICGMVEHEHTDACYQTRPVKAGATPAEGGNGDANSADLADLMEDTGSENGENETDGQSDDPSAETDADGDLDEVENATQVDNDENEAENQEQTEVGNEDSADLDALTGDTAEGGFSDAENGDVIDANTPAEGALIDEPADGEPSDIEAADADEAADTDAAEGELTDETADGEPSDIEAADADETADTDAAEGELTDGTVDGEPSDIEAADGEPTDGESGEPSDEESDETTDEESDEPSDEESDETADGETADGETTDGETTDKESDETADETTDEESGEPSDEESGETTDEESDETADEESGETADGEPTDETTDEETDETADGESADGETTDEETADTEPTDEESGEPAEFTAGERVIEVKDGSVTLTWGPEAEIPEDVRVEVIEIERGTTDYDILYNNAMAALSEKKDTETTTQVMRFFDITLYNGEDTIEPKAAISVTVQVNEAEATDNDADVDAVHMEDVGAQATVVEATTDSDTVSFEAESFSIYGVVVDVPATEAEEPPVSVAVDLSSVDLMAAAEVTDTVSLSIPDLLAGADESAVQVEGDLSVEPEALLEGAEITASEGVQVDGDRLVLPTDALESGAVSLEMTTYATNDDYETVATTHKVDIELTGYQGRTDVVEGDGVTVKALEGNSLPADAVATAQQVEPTDTAPEAGNSDAAAADEAADNADAPEASQSEEGSTDEARDGAPEASDTAAETTDDTSDADIADDADAVDAPSDGSASDADAPVDAADDTENESNEAPASDNIDATAETVNDTISGAVAYDITISNANEDVISETGMVEVALRPENLNIYEGLPANAVVTKVSYTLIHEHEGETQELPVDVDVDEAGNVTEFRFQTDKFSTSTLRYTVDFYYGDYEFHIPGEGYILLSRLFEVLHIDANAADAVNVEFTDPSLLAVYHIVEDVALSRVFAEVGSPRASVEAAAVDAEVETESELGQDGEDAPEENAPATEEAVGEASGEDVILCAVDWVLVSLQPFKSHETLTVTMADGTVYVIQVEDNQSPYFHFRINDTSRGHFGLSTNGAGKVVGDSWNTPRWTNGNGDLIKFSFYHDSTAYVATYAETNSRFVCWLRDNGQYADYKQGSWKNDGGSPNIVNTGSDVTFIAYFAPTDAKLIVITPYDSTHGSITTNGLRKVDNNGSLPQYMYSTDNVTLTASPSHWYEYFKGWYRQDGSCYSTNRTLRASDVTEDLVLTPVFEECYHYSTISNEGDKAYFRINDYYNTGNNNVTNLPSEGVPDEGQCSFKYSVYTWAQDSGYEFVYWLRDDGASPVTTVDSNGKQSVLLGFDGQTDYNALTHNTTYVAFYKPVGDYLVRVNEPAEGGHPWQSSGGGRRFVKDSFTNANIFQYYYANADKPVIEATADTGWMFVGWYNNGSELISTDSEFNVYNYVYGDGEGSHRDLNLTPVFRMSSGKIHVWFDGSNGIGGGDWSRNLTFYTQAYSNGKKTGTNSVYREYNFSNNQPATFNAPSASEVGIEAPLGVADTKFEIKGWYDVYNNQYYKVGDPISVDTDTVFYADWGPSTYDIGENTSLGYDLYTGSFIRTKVFDYNNLFNFESISLDRGRSIIPTQQGSTWKDWNREYWSMKGDSDDFIFMSTVSANGRSLNPYGRDAKNSDNETSTNGNKYTAIVTEGLLSSAKGRLFSTTNDPYSNPGHTYVGSDSYLYNYDSETGYYYFDSDRNAAAYNQHDQRFYVYNYTDSTNKSDASDGTDFLPFNYGKRKYTEGDGQVNYWFGMTSEIDFFLPNPTGFTDANGITGNRAVKGDEMIYKFAGDDDVWVYVDDQLVLDMGGVHGKIYGEINFSTGEWKVVGGGADKYSYGERLPDGSICKNIDYQLTNESEGGIIYSQDTLQLAEGDHTLKIYYLERGASQSNCAIYFNLAPRYGMRLLKEDSETQERLGGATFGVYADEACTLPANVWESRTKEKTNIFTTDTSGVNLGYAFCSGLVAGRTYYIKELSAPEGYPDVSEEIITLTLDSNGNPQPVTSTADNSRWTMATAEAGSVGESTLKLTVKNRHQTSITARKIWAMIDGSQYTRDENCEVTVKLKRYQLTDEQDDGNSTLPEYNVRLVSRYFADGNGKPINDNSGSIEIRSISTNKITRGGSISFEISAIGNTGIYAVATQYGRLTGAGFSNYTEGRPFIVNGGKASAAQFAAFTLSNIQRDTDIYVTYIGEAADADSLGGSIEITNITSGTGSSLKKVWDNSDFRAAQGKNDLQVTLTKPDWTYTWDGLDPDYYYTVEEVSSNNSLSANPLLPAHLSEIPAYVQTYSSDGLNSGTISVRNTLQALKVKLRKRDASNHSINVSGAEFKIYMKSETEQPGFIVGQQSVIEANVGHWLETITDGATTYTKTNTNYDTDKKVFVSDSYGRFYTGYLPLGTYYIYEVNAPEGYKKLDGPVIMQMTENGPQYQVPGKAPVNNVSLDTGTHSFYNVYIDNEQAGSLKITKAVLVNNQTPAEGNTQTNGIYEFTVNGVAETATAGIQRKAWIEFEGGKVKRTRVDDGKWVDVTGTDNTGYVVVPDLKPGSYTVTETVPTNGTELILATGGVEVSDDNVVTVNIEGGEDYNGDGPEAQASFTNNASTTYVEVHKTWTPAVPNGAQAIVRLYSDAKQSSEPTPTPTTRSVPVSINWTGTPASDASVTVTATRTDDNSIITTTLTGNGNPWTGELPGMTVGKTYNVGFTCTDTDAQIENISGFIATQDNTIITNGIVTEPEPTTRSVPVSINWTGTPASDASVTVTATRTDDNSIITTTLTGNGNSWTGELPGMTVGKAYNVVFTCTDTDAQIVNISGFTVTQDNTIITNGNVTGPEQDTRNVPVSISWTGTPASGASVTVTASRNGESDRTVTLTGTNSWSSYLENLIVGNAYTISFSVSNDTNATVNGGADVSFTVDSGNNVAVNGVVGRDVPVSISWTSGTPASDVQVVVTASLDGENDKTVTLNSTNNWNSTLSGMTVGESYSLSFEKSGSRFATLNSTPNSFGVDGSNSITVDGTVTPTRTIRVNISGDSSIINNSLYASNVTSNWGRDYDFNTIYGSRGINPDTGKYEAEVTLPISDTQYMIQIGSIDFNQYVVAPACAWTNGNDQAMYNVPTDDNDYTLNVNIIRKTGRTITIQIKGDSDNQVNNNVWTNLWENQWSNNLGNGVFNVIPASNGSKTKTLVVTSLSSSTNYMLQFGGNNGLDIINAWRNVTGLDNNATVGDNTYKTAREKTITIQSGNYDYNITITISASGSASATSPFQLASNLLFPVAYADDADIMPDVRIIPAGEAPPLDIHPVDGYAAITLDGTVDSIETEAWYYRWDDLPACNDDGSPIYYYVVELDAQALLEGVNAETVTATYSTEDNPDGGQTVTIVNEPEWPKGALTVTKQVTINSADPNGSTLADGTYTFTITGPNDYSSTGSITVENGEATDDIVLTGLTPGTYTVTEDATTNGTTLTGRSGGTNDGQRGIKLMVKPNDTATANIAVFTNNINTTSLTVDKTVVSPVPADSESKTFTFTVKVIKPDGTKLTGTYGGYTFDTENQTEVTTDYTFDANGQTQVTTIGNNSVTITGLPQGATYNVVEAMDVDFVNTATTGDTGTLGAEGATAAFTNTRKTGNLTVTKTTHSTSGEKIPVNPAPVYPLTIRVTLNGTTYFVQNSSGALATTAPETSLTVSEDQELTITGLPYGTYTVEELNPGSVTVTGYSYVLVTESAPGGSADVDETDVVVELHNYYTKGISWTPHVVKLLNEESYTGTDFSFRVVETDVDGVEKSYSQTVNNVTSGAVVFNAVPYTVDDAKPENNPHYYTITEIPGRDGNVDYDGASIYAVVYVTNNSGTLNVSDAYYSDSARTQLWSAPTFKNYDLGRLTVTKTVTGSYTPNNDAYPITVKKGEKFVEATRDGDTFTYTGLADNDPQLTVKHGQTLTFVNLPLGDYVVTEGDVSKTGYEITTTYEVGGETDGTHAVATVTKGNTAAVGITNHYRDAKLIITKTIAGIEPNMAADSITFTVTDAQGNKLLDKVALSNAPFTLSETTYTATLRSTDNADYAQYLIPGATYTVTETATAIDGHTLKSTTFHVTASEIQSGKTGFVTLSGTDTSTGRIDFTNVYTTPTSYTPRVVKALVWTGTETPVTSKWPDKGFTFTLHLASAVDGKTPISFTRADESVTIFSNTEGLTKAFNTIPFTVAGTYTFTITETVPDDAVKENVKWKDADAVVKAAGGLWKLNGITYNADPVTVVVTVTEDETTHALSASATYGGATVDAATITNTYDTTPTDAPVEVTKALVWKDTEAQIPADAKWPANGFEFKLAYVSGVGENGDFQDMDDAGVTLPTTQVVSAYATTDNHPGTTAKKAMFGNIHFEKAGTFTFTLTETVPSDAVNVSNVTWASADVKQKKACDYKFRKDGITYDGEPKTVTITVVDNNGVLAASVAYPGANASLTVTNTYDTLPTSYRPKADKVLKLGESDNDAPSSRWPSEGFTFTLAAVGGVAEDGVTEISKANVPMPEGVTETIKYSTGTDGEPEKVKNPEFGVIPYNAAGTYNYTITETVPEGAVNVTDTTWRKDGITYNNTPVTVQVVVEDVSGVLTVTSVIYDSEESKNNAIGEATATVKNKVELTDFEFNKKWFSSFETREAMGWPTDVDSIEVTIKRRLLYIDAKLEPTPGYTNSDNSFIKVYTLTPTSGTGDDLPNLTVTVKDNVYNYKLSDLEKYGRYDDHEGEWEYFVSETSLDTYSTIYKDADGNQINGAEQTRDGGTIENRFVTYTLPATGGMGTTAIYIAGASLLMLAVLGFIWLNRKRDDGTGI